MKFRALTARRPCARSPPRIAALQRGTGRTDILPFWVAEATSRRSSSPRGIARRGGRGVHSHNYGIPGWGGRAFQNCFVHDKIKGIVAMTSAGVCPDACGSGRARRSRRGGGAAAICREIPKIWSYCPYYCLRFRGRVEVGCPELRETETGTKALYINSPNNRPGGPLPRGRARSQQLRPGIWIFADDAYATFFGESGIAPCSCKSGLEDQ